MVRDAIPKGDPVTISYPIASPLNAEPMLWQAVADYPFRLVGGYAEHPDLTGALSFMPDQMNPAGLDLFLEGQEASVTDQPVAVTPALIATARLAAERNDVRMLLVDRSAKGAAAVVRVFSAAFGSPRVSTPASPCGGAPPARCDGCDLPRPGRRGRLMPRQGDAGKVMPRQR